MNLVRYFSFLNENLLIFNRATSFFCMTSFVLSYFFFLFRCTRFSFLVSLNLKRKLYCLLSFRLYHVQKACMRTVEEKKKQTEFYVNLVLIRHVLNVRRNKIALMRVWGKWERRKHVENQLGLSFWINWGVLLSKTFTKSSTYLKTCCLLYDL